MFFLFYFVLCQGGWISYYLENGKAKVSHFLSMRQRYTEVGIAQELQKSSCKLFPVSCHLSLNPHIKDLENSYGTNIQVYPQPSSSIRSYIFHQQVGKFYIRPPCETCLPKTPKETTAETALMLSPALYGAESLGS